MATTVEDICNPSRVSREDALRIAKERSEEHSTYEIAVFRYLTRQLFRANVDVDVVERALEIIVAIAPVTSMHSALRAALAHDEARVRSKAAVAIGRCIADFPLLQRLLTDTDARVRANTVEALWQTNKPEVENIFLRSLADPYHRTVANATYGLYLLDPEKYLPRVLLLIKHPHGRHRAAGAWLVGKIGEAAHLPLLRPLLLEKNTDVRGAAFRALALLRLADRKSADDVAAVA